MRKAFAFIISAIIVFAIFTIDSGCANIIPPAGGPRDSTPPRLINASPPDSTRNFKGNKIILTFDEYIKVDNAFQNILLTPTLENTPLPTEKGKTLTFRFDSLAANTTYTINFGDAIRDINEGNIARNFTYVFSTGPFLDSLELNGKIIIARTGKTDSTLTAVLYKNLADSAIDKIRPVYVARSDGKGNFHFKNLPPGKFAIYVFGNQSLLRHDKAKHFAFADSAVTSGKTNNITLYAYNEPLPPPTTRSTSTNVTKGNSDRRLLLAANLSSGQQDLLKDLIITFTTPLRSFDSTKVSLSTDSSYQPVAYSVALDTAKKEIRFKTTWREATRYNLVLNKDFGEDTTGKKLLKSDTLHFSTKKESDYGQLTLHIKNISTVLSKNPVLEFVQNDQVVFSAPVSSGVFKQTLFPPGDYQLRILYDTNGNGKWDPGDFATKRQPEIAAPIERRLSVKANFENEVEILL